MPLASGVPRDREQSEAATVERLLPARGARGSAPGHVRQEIACPGASRRGMTTESHEFLSYSQDKRSVHGQCRNGSPPNGCASYEVDALPAKVFMPGMLLRVIQSGFTTAV